METIEAEQLTLWSEPERKKSPEGASLGTNTVLGHTSDEHGQKAKKKAEKEKQQAELEKALRSKTDEQLDKLGKVLKANTGKGLRDNYSLSEVSHAIIRKYEGNTEPYEKYTDKAMPSFSRIPICGSILETYTAVKRTVEYGSYIQTHIAHCGNVWLCPVCGSIIQSRRADEVQKAIDWAEAHGYVVVMVTYTASHKAHYTLQDFGKRLQAAYRGTMKQLLRLRKKYEVGNIKAVEFTFSEENRWHKHFHVLHILKPDCNATDYYKKINAAWELQCVNVGLLDPLDSKAVDDFHKHSTSLSCGAAEVRANYINKLSDEWYQEAIKEVGASPEGKDVWTMHKEMLEYADKKSKDWVEWATAKAKKQKQEGKDAWTIADEMTKSVIKIGRSYKHMTPFQILYRIATTQDNEYRYRLIDAFIEYAIHTKGLHQQDWSNGLKAEVGIVDKTDEELCEEQKDTAVYVAGLTVAHWHLLRSKNLRIQYFKTLKSADSPEDAYSKLVSFFYEHGNDEGLLASNVLSAKDTELLETYYEKEDITDDEAAYFDGLKRILQAVAAEYNTYCAYAHGLAESSKHEKGDYYAIRS